MAVVDILAAFTYKWAQLGTAEALTDDQWKVGWSFIGAVPPSVEQFNKWGQVFDEKSNYLYSQLKTVYDLTGVVPGAADANSLRDALRGTGLFVTAAPGTSDTKTATTAFVAAAITASEGRLIATQVLSASGTYIRTAGATKGRLRAWGGGAGSSGSVTTGATDVSVGRGGGSGAYGEHWFAALPASQAFTIGAGGTGGAAGGAAGGAGGATVFGALIAPGAPATATANAYTPPALESGGLGALVATGFNIVNGAGASASHGHAVTTSSLVSGGGAPSSLGGGGAPRSSTSGAGNASPSRGAGGGGASNGASTAGFAGGAGGAGLIIIEEYV